MNDPGASTAVATPARTYREWAAWTAAALLLGTTLFFATRPSTISSSSSSRDSISFPVFPPEKAEFSARLNTTFNVPSFALSPDGRALVFSAAIAWRQTHALASISGSCGRARSWPEPKTPRIHSGLPTAAGSASSPTGR